MKLISINKDISTLKLECLILDKFGIKTEIINYKKNKAIKIDNRFSLNTIINKLRNDYSFTIHHKKNTDEYVLIILQQ